MDECRGLALDGDFMPDLYKQQFLLSHNISVTVNGSHLAVTVK